MNYYHPVKEDNLIYSIDNIRANFYLDKTKLDDLSRWISNASHLRSYAECFTQFRYKNLSTMTYSTEGSMTMGIGFNGLSEDIREDMYKGYLDFNPNKVADYVQFWEDYTFIKSCCKVFDVVRIDLAIDIPVKRSLMIIEKNKKHYGISAYSNENKTEYLGHRSTVGFVKLYNKTIEAKLEYDLTRLELTIEPTIKSFLSNAPNVYRIDSSKQIDISVLQLNDTDKYILTTEWKLLINGLDEGLMNFKSLGRKKYEKLKPFLLPDECKLTYSNKAVMQLLTELNKVFIC